MHPSSSVGRGVVVLEQEISAKVWPNIWYHFCLQNPPVGVAVEVVLQNDQIATAYIMNFTQNMD